MKSSRIIKHTLINHFIARVDLFVQKFGTYAVQVSPSVMSMSNLLHSRGFRTNITFVVSYKVTNSCKTG